MIKVKNKFVSFSVFLYLFLYLFISFSQANSLNLNKKLIDFGQNSPFIEDYASNVPKYENSPFDGITLKIPKGAGAGNIFMVEDWSKISNDSLNIIAQIAKKVPQSIKLADNFIAIFGGSQMDWFSNENWAEVEKNIRFSARIAKAAHCKGILWDPEPYQPGKNPWRYIEFENPKKIPFKDFYVQVRKRGAQFINALEEEFPGLTVLSLREFSDFQKGSPFSETLLPVTNIVETEKNMETLFWALRIPFTIGILDGLNSDTKYVDGNEEAYFYTAASEFFKARKTVKNEAKALIPESLHSKYTSNFQFGNAISADYIAGNWAVDEFYFPNKLKYQAKTISPNQQLKWLEHNAYYALKSADEYAWLWTEDMNMFTKHKLPEGFEKALFDAKRKVGTGKPLGFEIEQMMKNAREKAEKHYPEKKAKK